MKERLDVGSTTYCLSAAAMKAATGKFGGDFETSGQLVSESKASGALNPLGSSGACLASLKSSALESSSLTPMSFDAEPSFSCSKRGLTPAFQVLPGMALISLIIVNLVARSEGGGKEFDRL